MESTRFDQLTANMAERSTRRGALRFLGAATLSLGGLALLGADETDARKKRRKTKKRRKGNRSGGGNQRTTGPDTTGDEPTESVQCDGSEGTCCVDADCRADEFCANVNGTRHCFPREDGGPQFPDGTCAVDSDCRANEFCANVNGARHCFCRQELVCGQVCCPVGATCNQATGTCGF